MLHGPRLKPSTTVMTEVERAVRNLRRNSFSYHFGQTGARHSLLCFLQDLHTGSQAIATRPYRLSSMYRVTRVSARLEMPSSRATRAARKRLRLLGKGGGVLAATREWRRCLN